MNVIELLSRAGIYSTELDVILTNAINQGLPAPPVVANPVQAEEDEWLEPLRLGGTIILRGDL